MNRQASRRRRRTLGVFVVVIVLLGLAPAASATTPDKGALAEFEGRMIDMSSDWGDANACHVGDDGAKCFSTEKEMVAWLAENRESAVGGVAMAASYTCSSYMRLYDGTSYTGAALYLSTRRQWLNLSSYGFNQKTSSYKIGACNSIFADYNHGGGARYPTYLTQRYDKATSMLSGWNNDVSSVYMY